MEYLPLWQSANSNNSDNFADQLPWNRFAVFKCLFSLSQIIKKLFSVWHGLLSAYTF